MSERGRRAERAPRGVRGIALGLALALLSLAGSLGLANGVIEAWFPLPASMYRVDPVLLYRLVPGSRSTRVAGPAHDRRWIRTEINRAGYRGRELARVKTGPRIAVYGDSFVLAEDVRLEETFVERLGAELSSGAPIEMVNAGVKGYGPDQECLKLEREIDGLAPDLVVLVLYSSNDFGDLVRNKMFRVDPEGRAALTPYSLDPALAAEFEARARAARRPGLLRAYELWIAPRARPAPAPEPAHIPLYLAAAQDEHSEFALERERTVRQIWNDYYDADLAIHPEWESSAFKRALMEAVLARFQEQCARRRVPLCALVVPAAVDIDPDNEIRVDPELFPTWSPRRLTGTLAELLRGLDCPFLDLYAPFLAAGPQELYVGDGNMHWNAAGQELAARLTAAFLREQGLWPPAGD